MDEFLDLFVAVGSIIAVAVMLVCGSVWYDSLLDHSAYIRKQAQLAHDVKRTGCSEDVLGQITALNTSLREWQVQAEYFPPTSNRWLSTQPLEVPECE